MAWVYLDDKFPRHPKVMAAMTLHPLAPWLFVSGLCYCREHLNGGLMPALVIPTLTPLYKPAMKAALLAVALWNTSGEDWVEIHDYAQWNETEDDQREARSEKARKSGGDEVGRQKQRKDNYVSIARASSNAMPEHCPSNAFPQPQPKNPRYTVSPLTRVEGQS